MEVIRTGENMKKGQIYEGVIESVDFPNKAFIVTKEIDAEGEVKEVRTLVKGGIAGQKVSFTINKVRKDKCQGRIREVDCVVDVITRRFLMKNSLN